jgi:hypothetical protein
VPFAGAEDPSQAWYGAGLGRGVPPGKARAQDGALHRAELCEERSGVVGQRVALAQVLDPRCDLGLSAARHVGEEVVLDLVAEVAAPDVEQRAAVDMAKPRSWRT